jgi:hypothetical protein
VSASSQGVQVTHGDTQHTYVAPDTYVVRLTFTDDDGAENSVAKMVRVSNDGAAIRGGR